MRKKKPKPDRKRNGSNRIRITASVKPGLEVALAAIAEQDGMNRSQAIAALIQREANARLQTHISV